MVPAELRTRCWFRFWARGIPEEMRILGGDVDLVLFHCLLVEPQETGLVHVGEEHSFIFVGNVLPVRVVFSVLAKSVRILALPLVAAEVEADARAVLEFRFVGDGFRNWGAFFDVENTHREGFVRRLPLLPRLSTVAFGLALATFGSCSRRLRSRVLLGGNCGNGCGGDVAALLDEESPGEWGDFLRNGAVFDVLDHLLEKFRHEFHRRGDVLGVKSVVVEFDLVRVHRILGEGGKMLETLMNFSHKNKWHVRDRVTIIAHPSLRFFVFDHLDEFKSDLIEQRFGL